MSTPGPPGAAPSSDDEAPPATTTATPAAATAKDATEHSPLWRWGLPAALGAVAGVLAWWAWGPTTQQCTTFSQCFNRPISAMALTLVLAVAVMVAMRVLHLPRALLTGTVALLVGVALMLTGQRVTHALQHSGLLPWWSWMLLGAATMVLATLVVGPGTPALIRLVCGAVIIALVWGGYAWADARTENRRLAELAAVGVDPVLVPDLPGYTLSSAWVTSDPDDRVDYISLQFRPQGTNRDFPRGYRLPLGDWDSCELAVVLERSAREGECRQEGEVTVLDGEAVHGAGVVRSGTFLLVTGDPDRTDEEGLRSAVEDAVPGTLPQLRGGPAG